MLLYDTAAGAVRPLEPASDPVTLYVCGITPYDAAHLGHAFTYHTFDVVTRRLLAAGHAVRSVRNVTDVDDDIMRVSRERAVVWSDLVAEQVERFDREMSAINLLPVSVAPRASAHVPEMVHWVAGLEREGFAYARDGWVYFDVDRFESYGSLSRLDRHAMVALSRERGADPDDARKDDPLDFVLWQPSLPDEPSWPSPWGAGRPGWHIECSVLATAQLGTTVDLHGGGDDLIYPHHESEIAQVEATGVHPFVRHWMHVAMVRLDGVKMSKSLGNLVFVRDLLRDHTPGAVRLLLAGQHYRTPWSFSADAMDAAAARHAGYREAAEAAVRVETAAAEAYERDFFVRLDDDLDTPGALRILDELAAALRRDARRVQPEGGVAGELLLARLAGVLGVELAAAPVGGAGRPAPF